MSIYAQENENVAKSSSEETVLLQAYKHAATPVEKVEALESLAYHYNYRLDTVNAIKYGELYKEYADQTDNDFYQLVYYAGIVSNYGFIDKALYKEKYEEGVSYSKQTGDSTMLLKLTSAYADFLFTEENNTQASLKYLERAREMNQRIGDEIEEGYILSAMGRVSAEIGDLDIAVGYLKEATEIFTDPTLKLGAHVSVVEFLKEQGKIEEAVDELKTAQPFYEASIDKILKSDYQRVNGLVLAAQGKLDEAIAAFRLEKDLYFPDEHNDGSRELALGKAFAKKNQLNTAILWFQKSIDTGKAYSENGEMYSEAHLLMAETYNQLGNHEAAYSSLVEHRKVESEINESKEKALLNELVTKYETEKKEAENQLIKAKNARLQNRNVLFLALIFATLLFATVLGYLINQLGHQKKQLQRSYERLDQANSTKDQLFQILGHDLKRPAIAFQNMGKTLKYLVKKNQVEDLNEYASHIEEESLQLSNTVDNLLNWSLTQTEGFEPQVSSFLLEPFIDEVIAELNNQISTKQLNVRKELTVTEVRSDRNVLKIVLRNLLHNAMKFTPEGGNITIFSTLGDEQSWNLGVKDTGIGFCPALRAKIMEGGSQVTTVGTAGEAGNGMGLHLVRELAATLDGALNIQDNTPKGAVVEAEFSL
ncbi:MAG: tetratricopeptide repeat-containing sensor histidine kinase [Saprospiraceae bacterium]|nr:tetratricopeptide repeat-containing sensor histidine kinase [Saprospiraceae bacterium]